LRKARSTAVAAVGCRHRPVPWRRGAPLSGARDRRGRTSPAVGGRPRPGGPHRWAIGEGRRYHPVPL